MKKCTAIVLTLLMTLALTACGESTSQETVASMETTNTLPPETGIPTEATDSQEVPTTQSEESKTLVAYFSATGTTRGVAQTIAQVLGADLYEIVPEQPYTDADLNYSDDNSRSTVEMNDPAARPAIAGSVENMEQYDTVFVGYPIWWYDAPRIVSTFLESYDFSGKTIIPFCTSGGSGLGSSPDNLAQLTEGAQWLSGQRLNGGSSQEDVAQWIDSLGLGQ